MSEIAGDVVQERHQILPQFEELPCVHATDLAENPDFRQDHLTE
jgi:hypothetical protein